MTKSPRTGNIDPTIDSVSAGAGPSGGDEGRDGPGQEGQGQEGQEGQEEQEGQDLALDVEVEPPEPTPEQRIAELEAKQKETYDRYLRSVAELDNFRKRTRKEVEDARFDAQSRALREMLPVIDNLERAMAAAGGAEATNGHSIIEGVRLVLRQFAQALERCGVSPVAAHGELFDPTRHEAVSQVETDQAPPGTVVDVLQTGYRIGDRLLRPALVVVAKAPPARTAPGERPQDGEDGRRGNGHARGEGDRDGDGDGDDDGGESGADPDQPNGRDPEAA
jgi:molecular chaperone GrpE